MLVITPEGRAMLQVLSTALRWLAAGVVVLLAGERLFGIGFGALPIGLGLFGFGIGQRLRDGRAAGCRTAGPRLRPLQISALGLIVFGTVLARGPLGGPAPLAVIGSWLTADSRIAFGLVVVGVVWLGLLSLTSDCRDDALLRAMGISDTPQAGLGQPAESTTARPTAEGDSYAAERR